MFFSNFHNRFYADPAAVPADLKDLSWPLALTVIFPKAELFVNVQRGMNGTSNAPVFTPKAHQSEVRSGF